MAGVKGRSGRQPRERLWQQVLSEFSNRKGMSGKREIEELAEVLWAAAKNGDVTAIKEIGDRLDGKPAQQQIHTGDEDGGPVQMTHTIERKIVDAAN